jgi:spermidine synthase
VLAMTCPAVLAFTRSAVDVGYEYQYRSGPHVFFLEYVVTTVVVLGPTLLMGMTLPLLVGLVTGGDRAPGRTVGDIYAVNSLGTIVGAGLTGMVLIPYVGLRTTLMLFAVCNFSIGAYAASGRGRRDDPAWRTLTPVGCVCFVILSLLTPFGTRFIRPHSADEETVLYYAEGNAAIVHIVETEVGIRTFRILYVDSESVAGSSDEVVTDQKMLAHLPLLLHPDPKRALTVGFGSGGTSYAMLLHRIQVHCVEIEKAVPAGARFFQRQNYGVVNLETGLDPNRTDYRLILDDARSWLHLTPQPYDVIVDDLTSIQYRGNGNLYTVECFELIQRKLTPDGVGCAWIPIIGIDPGPLRVLIRSFRQVFPHTSIWYMNNLANDFAILVGTPGPLRIDLADWAARMSEPEIRDDLKIIHLDDPYKLAHCLLVAEDELDAYLGDGPVHTDDQPILDFLTHADVYRDTIAENLQDMLDHRADVQKYIGSIPEHTTEAQFKADMRRWGEAVGYVLQGHIQKRGGDPHAAGEAYRQAAERVPYDAGICELAGRQPVTESPAAAGSGNGPNPDQ